MRHKNVSWAGWLAVVCIALLCGPALSWAQDGELAYCNEIDKDTGAREAVMKALQANELIAVMRHTSSPRDQSANYGSCDHPDRHLSAEGETEAKKLRESLLALGLTDVTVYSSTACRTLETASLVFEVDALPWSRERHELIPPQCMEASGIRELAASTAEEGNRVFVTHNDCIKHVLKDRAPSVREAIVPYGLVVFFDDAGLDEAIGCIRP